MLGNEGVCACCGMRVCVLGNKSVCVCWGISVCVFVCVWE